LQELRVFHSNLSALRRGLDGDGGDGGSGRRVFLVSTLNSRMTNFTAHAGRRE
jgi:hypothetical protein